jgi:N-acetylneuraminic acid mutarotase
MLKKRWFVLLSLSMAIATLAVTGGLFTKMVDRVVSAESEDSVYLPLTVTSRPIGRWESVVAANIPNRRHENGYIQLGGKFYLLGGRSIKNVDIYDPVSNAWRGTTPPPIELHHFQAVTYDGLIYVIGAWTGPFPYEVNVSWVYTFDPLTEQWQPGHAIPGDRNRGSAGAVVYNDKIYLVGGVVGGHGDHATTVNWVDEYDPATGQWRELPDAPHARDHFHAVVADDKLYALGGRNSGSDNFADNTVPEVDVFDFATETWITLDSPNGDVPTQRAGTSAVLLGDEILLVGGEGFGQAWHETEALNINTHTWRTLGPLLEARHGTQIATCNDGLYIVAGSGAQGGAPELYTQERFFFGDTQPCLP